MPEVQEVSTVLESARLLIRAARTAYPKATRDSLIFVCDCAVKFMVDDEMTDPGHD